METVKIAPIKTTIKNNAVELRHSLDTKQWPSENVTAVAYRTHLQDSINHPTTTRLARQKYIDKPFKEYANQYWRNEQIVLNKDSETQRLLKELKGKMNKLYPTTQKAREYMVKTGRVDFDTVKKAKGYNWFDKLRIVFTRIK
ncbi:hypothetical protein J6A34_07890 [bacterium]|nr:hypothetical protein [bacterium]